jgi:D-alanyl-D-alanine carboxypeptidase
MSNPELAAIMSTKYYPIQGDRELRNHNRFLFTTPLAVAGKTGYTRASKHTYVGQFKNGDQEIIVAMMGSTKKWADLRPLIEKGFELAGTPIAKLPPAEEKLWFAKAEGNAGGYRYNSDWRLTKSMTLKDLARHEYYKTVFDMPFSVFALNINEGFGGASEEDQTKTLSRVENEFFELTWYLLS